MNLANILGEGSKRPTPRTQRATPPASEAAASDHTAAGGRPAASRLLPPSSSLRSPHNDRSPQRQALRLRVREAGLAPELEQTLLRPAVGEAAGAGPPEGADAAPGGREEGAAQRQAAR